jgi:predicted nucleic acid-binding protein
MIRTFFDSGVLIAAARSLDPDGERAIQLLEEPNRIFLTSPFVHLEVVPKAIFFKKRLEQSFYDHYFRNALWFREVGKIEAAAQTEAAHSGLSAMDALHLAAAHLSHADEFVTTEKPNRAIHRSGLVKVVYLFPVEEDAAVRIVISGLEARATWRSYSADLLVKCRGLFELAIGGQIVLNPELGAGFLQERLDFGAGGGGLRWVELVGGDLA